MRTSKRFAVVFFAVTLGILAILPVINVKSDYSRVLHRDYDHYYKSNFENLGYLKMAYLLEHRDEFDSLIFGSSRVRFGFDTATLEGSFGGHWYKMEYPGGAQFQHYHNLRALIGRGFIPKQVLLTIDDFDLWKSNTESRFKSQYNRRVFPVGLRETIQFYMFYLYKEPRAEELDILKGDLTLSPSERLIGENHGWAIPANADSAKHDAKLRALPAYQRSAANKNYDYSESAQYIARFVALCNEHDIPLRIAYLPSTPKTLVARNHDRIRDFKRELVRVHEFHDFMGIFPITENTSNWLEMSHFRTPIGDAIVQAIAAESPEPGEFGSLVTPETIESHLGRVDQRIRDSLPGMLRSGEKLSVSSSLRGRKRSRK